MLSLLADISAKMKENETKISSSRNVLRTIAVVIDVNMF